MCDSPRTWCARRITPVCCMWCKQAIIQWSRWVISIVACCHSVKLCALAPRPFRAQHYTLLFLVYEQNREKRWHRYLLHTVCGKIRLRRLAFCSNVLEIIKCLGNRIDRRDRGCRKGDSNGPWPPWILKFSAKKVVFLCFGWEKTNFTTFDPPGKTPSDTHGIDCEQ